MSSFTSPLIGEWVNGRYWQLHENFCYRLGIDLKSPDHIDVPAGFVTDFASVPRVFWSIFPPTGTYGKAAVLHDYLYQNGDILWDYIITPNHGGHPMILNKPRIPKPNRAEADGILLEAMGVVGVNPVTKRIVYWGVRLGGGIAWKRGHRSTCA